MKHIYLRVPGSTTEYLPLFDKCRVVSAKATASIKQSSASSLVKIQKASASHATFQADLHNVSVGSVTSMSTPSSATSAEAKTIFGPDTPIQIKTELSTSAASAIVTVNMMVDDFLIGGD